MAMTIPGPLLLQAWLSPAFPVGGFAYSHALEQAHAEGEVSDATTLHAWLAAHRECGSLRHDACVLALAWRAAVDRDDARLAALNELAIALAGGAERRLETTAQGTAFARGVAAAWSTPAFERLRGVLHEPRIAYPCIVGAVAATHGIALRELVPAYAFAWLSNLASAAMRLGIVGQSDAQRLLASFAPALGALARHAASATEDDLGTGTLRGELQALRHETLYTRLFRS